MITPGYTGPQDPFTATNPYNAYAFLIQQITGRMATVALVSVQSVTPGGEGPVGTVSVQPLVGQIDGQGNVTAHGVIGNVPYFRMQGGASAVIMDPKPGDIGFAVFCSRDISSVKATKKAAGPSSRRQYDWADALYVGGVLNGAPTQYIEFTDTGIKIVSPSVEITGNLTVDGTTNLGGAGATALRLASGGAATKANAV